MNELLSIGLTISFILVLAFGISVGITMWAGTDERCVIATQLDDDQNVFEQKDKNCDIWIEIPKPDDVRFVNASNNTEVKDFTPTWETTWTVNKEIFCEGKTNCTYDGCNWCYDSDIGRLCTLLRCGE